MSSHMLYEMGIATMISSTAAKKIAKSPSEEDLKLVLNGDFFKVFEQKIKAVADKKYYDRYLHKGWTATLALETKKDLLPEVVSMVALGWLEGIRRSKEK